MPKVDWGLMRSRVFPRDKERCMAPVLDDEVDVDSCRGRWGEPAIVARRYTGEPIYAERALTLDHVHRHPGGTKGKKASDDPQHLVTVCWHHHLEGWATSKRGRGLERGYLNELYGPEVLR